MEQSFCWTACSGHYRWPCSEINRRHFKYTAVVVIPVSSGTKLARVNSRKHSGRFFCGSRCSWSPNLPNSVNDAIQRSLCRSRSLKVTDYQFWHQRKARMRFSMCELIVTYLLSRTVSEIWRIIGPIFTHSRGASVWCNRWWWTPILIIAIFRLKKQETSLYCKVWSVFRHLELFRRDSQVWWTDRRTDGRTDCMIASVGLHCTSRSKKTNENQLALKLLCA